MSGWNEFQRGMQRDAEEWDRHHRTFRRSIERARMISTILFIVGLVLFAMTVGFILVQPETVGAWFGRVVAGFRGTHG